jgi:hypothetical protein
MNLCSEMRASERSVQAHSPYANEIIDIFGASACHEVRDLLFDHIVALAIIAIHGAPRAY